MIPVLYEDKSLVVCVKPVGVLSAPEPGKRRNMPELLKKQTRAYRIDTIHRLDQPVGGVMVYSKSSKATPGLYKQMAGHRIVKEYLAVVHGDPPDRGTLRDLLGREPQSHRTYVADAPNTRGAKDASLSYRVLATVQQDGVPLTLVKVRLHTGRTHQIRVQFSSRLLGDEKYGGLAAENFRGLGLWSYHLAFRHPLTGATVDNVCPPPTEYPWTLFGNADLTAPVNKE